MKNLKMLMLAVAGCLTLASCSDDDNNDNVNNNPNADITGTYRMTAWNAPTSIDFDGDGTSNINMMNESPCYNNSIMNVNSDGTYTMTYRYVNIESGAVSCGTETTNGTWVRNGNSFTTTHMSAGQSMSTDYSFSGGNQTTLTRNMNNWNYPSINGTGGQVYSTGNVSMVMTRE